jgi:hypothetical protein
MSSNLHALAGYLVRNYLKQILHQMCHSWWMQFEHALKNLNYFTGKKKGKKIDFMLMKGLYMQTEFI